MGGKTKLLIYLLSSSTSTPHSIRHQRLFPATAWGKATNPELILHNTWTHSSWPGVTLCQVLFTANTESEIALLTYSELSSFQYFHVLQQVFFFCDESNTFFHDCGLHVINISTPKAFILPNIALISMLEYPQHLSFSRTLFSPMQHYNLVVDAHVHCPAQPSGNAPRAQLRCSSCTATNGTAGWAPVSHAITTTTALPTPVPQVPGSKESHTVLHHLYICIHNTIMEAITPDEGTTDWVNDSCWKVYCIQKITHQQLSLAPSHQREIDHKC